MLYILKSKSKLKIETLISFTKNCAQNCRNNLHIFEDDYPMSKHCRPRKDWKRLNEHASAYFKGIRKYVTAPFIFIKVWHYENSKQLHLNSSRILWLISKSEINNIIHRKSLFFIRSWVIIHFHYLTWRIVPFTISAVNVRAGTIT